MRVSIGVDPDSTTTALATVVVDDLGRILLHDVAIIRTESFDLCAVGLGISDYLERTGTLLGGLIPGGSLEDVDPVLLTVEEPQIYAGVRTKPQDIAKLGMVTGAVMGASSASDHLLILDSITVLPAKWKGQLPKRVSQARSWRKLDIPCDVAGKDERAYCVPNLLGSPLSLVAERKKILKSDWRHLGDALGIALWRLEQKTA